MLGFAEIFVQTFLAFFAVFFYARILGKAQISQLTFYEYVNGITLGSIAATMATDIADRTLNHFIALSLFFAFTFIFSLISLKNRPMRKIIQGEPVILIHNGKILEGNMAKMRYNMDELTEQLREKDVFDMGDVEFAVSETDGTLSVLLKSDRQPVTPSDMSISTNYEGIASELIIDGKIIYQNLKQNNLNQDWLLNKLKEQGINSVEEVAFAEVDTGGNFYVDKVEDNLQNTVDVTDHEKSDS